MQLNLIVLTEGKVKGKAIPVRSFPFIVGRDSSCQLRPASPLISKRHCALLVRDNKVFVHDFQSTNGTFVNDRQIMGDIEIRNEDHLTIGPLTFAVKIEVQPPVSMPTPPPVNKDQNETTDDEAAAAMLLSSLPDSPPKGSSGVDSEGIPTGSTVMDVPAPQAETEESGKDKKKKPNPANADTSATAKNILDKYRRRPRE